MGRVGGAGAVAPEELDPGAVGRRLARGRSSAPPAPARPAPPPRPAAPRPAWSCRCPPRRRSAPASRARPAPRPGRRAASPARARGRRAAARRVTETACGLVGHRRPRGVAHRIGAAEYSTRRRRRSASRCQGARRTGGSDRGRIRDCDTRGAGPRRLAGFSCVLSGPARRRLQFPHLPRDSSAPGCRVASTRRSPSAPDTRACATSRRSTG